MKLSVSNQQEQTNAIIGVYGPPKSGKTFSIATGLPLGNILRISSPGEGNVNRSLDAYPISQIRLENYKDLMTLEAALLNKPAGWVGDDGDTPVALLNANKTKHGPIDPAQVAELREFIPDNLAIVCIDGIAAFQADIFATQSIAHWGKELEKGLYGDVAKLTRIHLQRLASITGVKFVIFISQDMQVTDKSMGGIESTVREMEFEGKASRKIIPRMCDMVLPIFSASQLGQDFPTWKCTINGNEEERDRYFLMQSMMGYWAGAGIGLTNDTTTQADFNLIWNKYYANKETK